MPTSRPLSCEYLRRTHRRCRRHDVLSSYKKEERPATAAGRSSIGEELVPGVSKKTAGPEHLELLVRRASKLRGKGFAAPCAAGLPPTAVPNRPSSLWAVSCRSFWDETLGPGKLAQGHAF